MFFALLICGALFVDSLSLLRSNKTQFTADQNVSPCPLYCIIILSIFPSELYIKLFFSYMKSWLPQCYSEVCLGQDDHAKLVSWSEQASLCTQARNEGCIYIELDLTRTYLIYRGRKGAIQMRRKARKSSSSLCRAKYWFVICYGVSLVNRDRSLGISWSAADRVHISESAYTGRYWLDAFSRAVMLLDVHNRSSSENMLTQLLNDSDKHIENEVSHDLPSCSVQDFSQYLRFCSFLDRLMYSHTHETVFSADRKKQIVY